MKKLNLTLGLFTLITITAGLYLLKKEFLDPTSSTIISAAPTIEELQEMSELVSTRVIISDILEGENDHFKGSWIVKGDALITTDLSKAQFSNINTTTRTAILALPEPKITSARVDHEKTRTHNVTKKAWIVNKDNESRLRDNAMKEAQKLIKRSANKPQNITSAKRKAEVALQNFYKSIDWEITITWKNPFLP